MKSADAQPTKLVFNVALLALALLTSTCILQYLCQNPVTANDNTQRADNDLDIYGLNLLQTGITLSRSKTGTAGSSGSSNGISSARSGKIIPASMAVVSTGSSQVATIGHQQPPQSGPFQPLPPPLEVTQHHHPLPPTLLSLSWPPWKHPSDGPVKGVQSADDLLGVKKNSSGDLKSILHGLVFNCIAMFFISMAFWFLRTREKTAKIYINEKAPENKMSDMPFSWATASWTTTTDEAVFCAGLDQALLIEFCDVSMKILGHVALPITVVLCPLHFFLGGNRALLQGDNLSRIAMGNVVRPHPWMLYIHAFFVWMVAITTQRIIHQTMQSFLIRRSQWLKELPNPQASTILVEGIPDEYRSDAKLREFFEHCFEPSVIKSAHVVKDSGKLIEMHRNTLLLQEQLCKAEFDWAKKQRHAEFRPQMRKTFLGDRCDAIETYTKEIEKNEQLIKEFRQEVIQTSQQGVGNINTRNGFVTFASRREAELAVNLQYSNICVEWQVSYAPEPEGVDWDDLKHNVGPRLNSVRISLGYAIVMALYVAFLPVCVATTNIAYEINLGPLQSLWMAIAPSLSLTIFMSFLPTVMINTFDRFFILKSKTLCQLKLQHWYFWFQVFFIILVTAIGKNFTHFVTQVAREPPSLFLLLARVMPDATHFYMSYIILQCTLQVWGLIRSAQLGKFLAASTIFEEEEARKLAEPEDQDYYGIGSRSARATIILMIGIIFSTLSPVVAVLSMAFFFVARLVYGYLIVFAETKKPDLGGAFFVLQLQHLQVGIGIYCILMTGVLGVMAPTIYPAVIAGPSLFYTLLSAKSFREDYLWEKLPFREIGFNADSMSPRTTEQNYVQPELNEVFDANIGMSVVSKISSQRNSRENSM